MVDTFSGFQEYCKSFFMRDYHSNFGAFLFGGSTHATLNFNVLPLSESRNHLTW